jgi:hypothetical protein
VHKIVQCVKPESSVLLELVVCNNPQETALLATIVLWAHNTQRSLNVPPELIQNRRIWRRLKSVSRVRSAISVLVAKLKYRGYVVPDISVHFARYLPQQILVLLGHIAI